MSNLRQAQKRMTRGLLLDSALAVFAAKGYGAATIDEIAAGAGTTRTTFYLHFSSKADLMGALIDDVDELIVSSDVPPLGEVVASGDREALRAWVARRFDQWPTIMPYVTAAEQAMAVDTEIADRVAAWEEHAVDRIVEGLAAAGRFPAGERRLRAALAFAQVTALAHRWARHGWADGTRAAALETVTELLHEQLVGLGSPPGGPAPGG